MLLLWAPGRVIERFIGRGARCFFMFSAQSEGDCSKC